MKGLLNTHQKGTKTPTKHPSNQIIGVIKMSEILTTKQFKATHQLSDSAFQRLVKKICDASEMTRQELICPINSTEHQIIKPELFEAAVSGRKPRATKAIEIVEATLEPDPIPCTSIQVMSSDRANSLDDILGTFQAMQVYKPKQIELNGSQDEIADLLTVYASKIQEKQTEVEGRKAALSDREEKLEKARLALSVMGSVEAGIESEATEINDKAKDLGAVETDVKKQLAAILASLS